jgi:hypothetical protein
MVKSQSPSQASSSPLNYATGGRSQGSDDDSELGKALLLAQTARKVTLSDPDKAFKQFVQAAKCASIPIRVTLANLYLTNMLHSL